MSLYNDASLAMIPSAVKDGKLYSIRPSDGSGDFTFSRGSNLAATRVDVNGLIEKGRENLLTYSNDFSQWVNINTTETGGQLGYDGTNNAWLLSKSTATDGRIEKSISSNTSVLTASIYAKSGSTNIIRLRQANPNISVDYDLSTGTFVSAVGSGIIDHKITSVGNGWYRISITGQNTLLAVSIYPIGASGSSIYIQDAQLEVGLVATDYIETTTTTAVSGITEDLPRLDYSGGASCPSLLLEPTRTNSITQSEYFDSSVWTKNDVLVEGGYASPEGNNNAYKITKNGVNATLVGFAGINTSKHKSIWARTISGTGKVTLLNVQSDANALFDLTEEWQRFDIAHNGADFFYAVDFRNASATLTEVLIYGAQLEEGYSSSYIPTYGSAVTRSGDSCDNAGNNTIIKTQQGTLFVEIAALANDGTNRMISLTNGVSAITNATIYYRPTNNRIRYIYEINSVQQADIIYDFDDALEFIKVAAVYEQDRFVLFVNGVKVDEVLSGDVAAEGTFNEVAFDRASQLPFYGKNKQLVYFPTALTDSECIALTTL